MKHILPFLLAFALFAPSCSVFNKKTEPQRPVTMSTRAGGDRNQNYVEQFKDAAMLEMERGGVPASITLAQGILESGAGSSDLAQNANNHFGIKCGSTWNGKTYKKKDDDKDADGNLIESCFRKYEKVEESFLDHAAFLRDPKKEFRYGFLFKLDRTDYKGWAEGLEASGYSTSDTYAEKLIDIIERYKLYEFDLPADTGKPNRPPDPNNPDKGNQSGADIPLPNPSNRIGRINETQVVLAREGETVADIAKSYRLSPNTVAEYNDRGYTPIQKLKANTRVFIQQKKDRWNGSAFEHVVKNTETMFDISQLYGVKLNKLLDRNGLRPGQEPAAEERIRLKGKRKKGDSVRLRDASNDDPAPNQPGGLWPTPPSNDKLKPDEEGYLPEIGGGEQEKPKPEPTKPPVTPEPAKPPANAKPPSVVGTPYPSDPTPSQPDKPAPVSPDSNSHLVVKGDTLTNIARRYSTTVPRLRQLNGLKDDNIKIGQTLRIR